MRLSCLLLATSAIVILASCQGGGQVDVSNPTVAELDRLDTQWGLPPRTSRGAPKRSYQYSSPTSSASAPSTSAPASVPPRETLHTPPPAGATLSLDPALR